MPTYRNIDERWGCDVGGLTFEDYQDQAEHYDLEFETLTADEEGIYDGAGERIAVPD